MSIEARPNINAAGLAVRIIEAILELRRGPALQAEKGDVLSAVNDDIVAFCEAISDDLDERFGK